MLVLGSPCFILFFLFLISISEICFSFYNSFSNFSPKIFIKFFYLNYHVSISNIKKKKICSYFKDTKPPIFEDINHVY